jgi:hypothetical protein
VRAGEIATGTPEGITAGATRQERQPGRRIRKAGKLAERIVGDTEQPECGETRNQEVGTAER